jgi:hypothetical protein
MKTFILFASGLVCGLYACTFEVDVNHKGIPKSFEHEISAPGIFAPAPKEAEDAGTDGSADSAE